MASLIERIDQVVQAGGKQFYIEILAKHGIRQPRPVIASEARQSLPE